MNDIPRSLIQINDHVWIDTGRMTVIRDGNETPLTARMWHLLKVLLDHGVRVVTERKMQ